MTVPCNKYCNCNLKNPHSTTISKRRGSGYFFMTSSPYSRDMNLIPSERGTTFIFFYNFSRPPILTQLPLFMNFGGFYNVTVSCHQWSLIEIHPYDLLLKFTQPNSCWRCKIFAWHLLCNGKLYLKTNFIHSRYIFKPPFLFNLQFFLGQKVLFRVLWKHIFHELLFILSQHRNYYTDWFSFDSTRKIFLRNFFLAGVNIKVLILTAVKIS